MQSNRLSFERNAKRNVAVLFSALALFAIILSASCPAVAFGDDVKNSLEEANIIYQGYVSEIEAIDGEIAETQLQIDAINEKLPALQEEAETAVNVLYRMKRESALVHLMSIVFGSDSLENLIGNIVNQEEYVRVCQSRIDNLEAEKELLGDLESSLEEKKSDRVKLKEQAEQQYASMVEERISVLGGIDVSVASEPVRANLDPMAWDDEKYSFVSEWAPRIDAYLNRFSSPLNDYGAIFASAAYDVGIDPRIAPAIAFVDTSLGRNMVLSRNAWGMDGKDYSNWVDSIYSYSSWYRSMYGSEFTESQARRYSPGNWRAWHAKVSSEMRVI